MNMKAPASPSPSELDIMETARADNDFDALVKLLEKADLAWILKSNGPFTLLAPTDKAFDSLPAGVLERLHDPANKTFLQQVMANHIYSRHESGGMTVDQLMRPKSFGTWYGQVHTWPKSRQLWLYDDAMARRVTANFVKEDILCTNGYLHGLDTVLFIW